MSGASLYHIMLYCIIVVLLCVILYYSIVLQYSILHSGGWLKGRRFEPRHCYSTRVLAPPVVAGQDALRHLLLHRDRLDLIPITLMMMELRSVTLSLPLSLSIYIYIHYTYAHIYMYMHIYIYI